MTMKDNEVVENATINGVIYKATNTVNGRVYIGLTTQGLEGRRKAHLYDAKNESYGSYFHNAIRKYGESSFIWEEIDSSGNIEDLNKKEVYWVDYYNSYGDGGYNLTIGGEGVKGLVRSDGFREGKSELFKEMWENGHTETMRRGSDHPLAVIIESEAIEIKNLILKEIKLDCIASIYGITISVVNSIKRGVSWRHVITDEDVEEMALIKYRINKVKAVEIKNMILEGKTLNSIAKIYDTDKSTISAIKRGVNWKDVITEEDVKRMNEVMPIKIKRILTEKEVLGIKGLLLEGVKIKEVADIYGIATNTVSLIKRGERWIHLFTKEELEILNSPKIKIKRSKPTKTHSDLTRNEIIEIKNHLSEGLLFQREIAELYKISRTVVSQIKNGQIYSDVG